MRRGLACALTALFAATIAATACAAIIDTGGSRIGFTLKTRWGQSLEGRFPVYDGQIVALDDGRKRVQLSLSARDIEIVDNRNYTRLTRGKGFFDAERFPEVTFVSDPYAASLTREGGTLGGMLSIRGVQRREVFTVAPSVCGNPGEECDVIASGTVQRGDYGVDRWSFALSESVRFDLRIRTRGGGT